MSKVPAPVAPCDCMVGREVGIRAGERLTPEHVPWLPVVSTQQPPSLGYRPRLWERGPSLQNTGQSLPLGAVEGMA